MTNKNIYAFLYICILVFVCSLKNKENNKDITLNLGNDKITLAEIHNDKNNIVKTMKMVQTGLENLNKNVKIKQNEGNFNETRIFGENNYTFTSANNENKSFSNILFSSEESELDSDVEYFYKKNIKCNKDNCPSPNECVTSTVCKCAEGYANYEGQDSDDKNTKVSNQNGKNKKVYCQYVQKKQLVAFLLEFFASLGIGHFYCGRVIFGTIKLVVFLGPIIVGILTCCCGLTMKPDESTSNCLSLVIVISSCTLCCAALIWQLVDCILFGINKYHDGNGVPLQHW